MPSPFAECSAPYFFEIDKALSTRSCIPCGLPISDMCYAGGTFAPRKAAKVSLQKSHYLACSSAYWNVELANLSRNCGALVPRQDAAPARNLKELQPSSTPLVEKIHSSSQLRSETIKTPAPVDTTTVVVRIPVTIAFSIPSPVFRISDFEQTEYRAFVLNVDHPAQAARLTNPDFVKLLRRMVHGNRWMNVFGSIPVAKRAPPSNRLAVTAAGVDGKVAVSLYLHDDSRRRAVRRAVDDPGID